MTPAAFPPQGISPVPGIGREEQHERASGSDLEWLQHNDRSAFADAESLQTSSGSSSSDISFERPKANDLVPKPELSHIPDSPFTSTAYSRIPAPHHHRSSTIASHTSFLESRRIAQAKNQQEILAVDGAVDKSHAVAPPRLSIAGLSNIRDQSYSQSHHSSDWADSLLSAMECSPFPTSAISFYSPTNHLQLPSRSLSRHIVEDAYSNKNSSEDIALEESTHRHAFSTSSTKDSISTKGSLITDSLEHVSGHDHMSLNFSIYDNLMSHYVSGVPNASTRFQQEYEEKESILDAAPSIESEVRTSRFSIAPSLRHKVSHAEDVRSIYGGQLHLDQDVTRQSFETSQENLGM